ncbi:hypothetical protein TIFTF001_023918 [Ficus carica]|uniref:Uncharacterized protein n=1 Tax=Ficus carica TaxID=3494 RepID=A0AA88DGK0_FICCA|nr:hypothetical protein TIFTF001_023918 [Ficus carica]
MTAKQKVGGRGRGRPRKIPSATAIGITQQENPISVKRGRGRPRKYPPKPNPPAADQPKSRQTPPPPLPPPDLVGLTKSPGMASAWGSAQKGKRVNVKGWGREWGKENSEDSSFPSVAEEFDYSSSSTESNSRVKGAGDSWLSDFVIPGPIPNLDELFWDQSILGHEDFFADLPDIWDV